MTSPLTPTWTGKESIPRRKDALQGDALLQRGPRRGKDRLGRRKREGGPAITAIGGSQQGKQGLVHIDRQELAI